jgi:hypothetical protein
MGKRKRTNIVVTFTYMIMGKPVIHMPTTMARTSVTMVTHMTMQMMYTPTLIAITRKSTTVVTITRSITIMNSESN